MVDDLRAFVTVESGSGDKSGVDRAGELLTRRFGEAGFSWERISVPGGGDHVVARRAGTGTGRLMILLHLDTVWPRGTLRGFPFRVEGERAYGPGVADMKGGWVIALWALRALADTGGDGLESITVFMSGDEELGSVSARPHIERIARESDWVLVMEPGRESGAVVIGRGAVGALALDVTGRTAHAIHGERGASAIEALARKITAITALTDRARGVVVNVGVVRGGSARQVVPDGAWASIDLRSPTTPLAEQTLARLREIVAGADVAGTRAALHGGITRPAFERNPGTDGLFGLAQRAATPLGLTLEGEVTGAGSDGNFCAALGIPTLDGLGAHGFNVCSREEYILIESLPQRAALLAGIIAGLPALAPGGTRRP